MLKFCGPRICLSGSCWALFLNNEYFVGYIGSLFVVVLLVVEAWEELLKEKA